MFQYVSGPHAAYTQIPYHQAQGGPVVQTVPVEVSQLRNKISFILRGEFT